MKSKVFVYQGFLYRVYVKTQICCILAGKLAAQFFHETHIKLNRGFVDWVFSGWRANSLKKTQTVWFPLT